MSRFVTRSWVPLVALGVAVALLVALLLREDTEFSDAPDAADLALSGGGSTLDIHYATCRRADDIPRLLVWEESDDGRLRWATFFRTGGPRSAYWLSRREDGVTYEPGEGDELPPMDEARVTIHLLPEGGETIEVTSVPVADLPLADAGGEVLLADGTTTDRESWLAERKKPC